MAPMQGFSHKKVLILYLVLIFLSSMYVSASTEVQSHSDDGFIGRRKMLGLVLDDEEEVSIEKEKDSTSVLSKTKNLTKLVKATSTSSSKNQTKLIKSLSESTKNKTKLIKSPFESTKNKTTLIKPTLIKPTSVSDFEDQPIIKTKLKKLNSTSKSSNSTKTGNLITKKSSDLTKLGSAAKPKTAKESKSLLDSAEPNPKSNASSDEISKSGKSKPSEEKTKQEKSKASDEKPKSEKSLNQTLPSWVEQDDDDDIVSGFSGLPSKFQESVLPDLEKISKTSQVYLNKANKEMTKGFKPYVGKKYAPALASFISFASIIIPLVVVSLIFNKFKAYFSLQKVIIFIQIYLSIYFSILCISTLITGLEPLKFFYATSPSTYFFLQVLQTLAYALYLLLLLMYLVLVFPTETGLTTKLLLLGQTFVGFSVGLHYYMMVFHTTVLRQPPKTSWKTHAIYATCFLLISALTRAYTRKKADNGKMS